MRDLQYLSKREDLGDTNGKVSVRLNVKPTSSRFSWSSCRVVYESKGKFKGKTGQRRIVNRRLI